MNFFWFEYCYELIKTREKEYEFFSDSVPETRFCDTAPHKRRSAISQVLNRDNQIILSLNVTNTDYI